MNPSLYFHSIRHLKSKQVYYRSLYKVRDLFPDLGLMRVPANGADSLLMNLAPCIPSAPAVVGRTFSFLNRSHEFPAKVDWEYGSHGRLWAYNLNYFDYLSQAGMDVDEGLALINEFLEDLPARKTGLEPYPLSLRSMNWIKFLCRHRIRDGGIESSLYCQLQKLLGQLEYHLLGNHLLENGFALLFGGCFFRSVKFWNISRRILEAELREQVLVDGGHFERSPMYHQIVLCRVLDSINLLRAFKDRLTSLSYFGHNFKLSDVESLLELLTGKAGDMLGWLRELSFADGSFPLVNDAANGIAPRPEALFSYAGLLGLSPGQVKLGESGYRKISRDGYEMVVDVGSIGPDYIPGHAHSDTFSFELAVSGKPVIVDTGTSTYEPGEVRGYERSTAAHNTVQVDGLEQSETWASHRVGRRAKILDLVEEPGVIISRHDGFKKIGAVHRRGFSFSKGMVTISDEVESRKMHECRAFFHFHPEIDPGISESVIAAGPVKMEIRGANRIWLDEKHYSPEFNKRIPAKVLVAEFNSKLQTDIFF